MKHSILLLSAVLLSSSAFARSIKESAPIRIDGLYIYAETSNTNGYQGSRTADKVCQYFGYKESATYTRSWSVDYAGIEVAEVIADGQLFRVVKKQLPEQGNIFTELSCYK